MVYVPGRISFTKLHSASRSEVQRKPSLDSLPSPTIPTTHIDLEVSWIPFPFVKTTALTIDLSSLYSSLLRCLFAGYSVSRTRPGFLCSVTPVSYHAQAIVGTNQYFFSMKKRALIFSLSKHFSPSIHL